MLWDQQSAPLTTAGKLVDLLPGHHIPVKFHWHCWNSKSDLLEKLTTHLIRKAKTFAAKIAKGEQSIAHKKILINWVVG